jgi:hypothetical protein
MYRIPKELDLSPVAGQFTTQIGVGQFDIQFEFGDVHFSITSEVKLFRSAALIGRWTEGQWPDASFYDIMNTNVIRCEIRTDRLIVLSFENGIEMHLADDSDQYECMLIKFKGSHDPWIV